MADNKVLIELQLVQKGDQISLVQKQTDKLTKSQDQLSGSTKKLTKNQGTQYTRTKQGVIQTANSTKNFSKMQQSIDGGGGAGGLVRAYALLAANVFALSAAFGILSRAAQVDTLIESMEVLEVTTGRSIKNVARDLQEASGFGLDFAAAMRSVSLATSAGFGAEQIGQLGEVARNAAVSLGRNMPDALDRIFRGVIKVEPELLDEIGLFVRVNEAAAKFASGLGVAAGDLTEFQKRQAFLTEALEQGTKKFEAFADVDTDPFSKLQTTFVDITQSVLTFINKGLSPVVNFLSENKLLFTTIFAAVAVVLARMAIPAMGAFTQSVAANAAMNAKAASEAIKNAQAKAAVADAEHKKELVRQKEILELRAQEQRFTDKPQQLKVRGRDKSKKLEVALMKEELTGKARINVIEQRLADINSKRGKQQRDRNTDVQREKNLLKQELEILKQIEAKQQQINDKGVTGIRPGSVADRAAKEAAGKAIRSQGIANIATVAETQGVTTAFKSLGAQLAVVKTQSKAAGVSFGLLRQSLFAVRGAAVIAATGFQALWMSIMGPLSIILLFLPALQALARFAGFGSKEQEKLTEANKQAAEAFDLLPKRIENATKQLEKFAATGNSMEMSKARLAIKETVISTSEALQEQQEAFEDYQKSTRPIVKGINRTLTFLNPFSKAASRQLRDNQKEFISSISQISDEMTPAMKELIAAYEDDDTAENRQKIIDLATKEAEAYKNVHSALEGARDAAREYSDSLIVKTQVDKPLASFRQINSALANGNLSLREQKELLDATVKDSAILSLLTKDQENALAAANGDRVKQLAILQEVENSFFRQQELLIRQKNELAQIDSLMKLIKDAQKLSISAVEMQFNLTNKRKRLEKELLDFELQRKLAATGLTEAQVREISQLESLVGLEEKYGLEKENISAVQAAINQLKATERFELEETVRLATEDLERNKSKLQATEKILSNQIKLNQEKSKEVSLDAKILAFAKRGSTTLTGAEGLAMLKEQERLRRETVEQEKDTKEKLAAIEFDILIAQMNALASRAEILAQEQQLVEQQEKAFLARELGVDNIFDPKSLEKALDFNRRAGAGGLVDRFLQLQDREDNPSQTKTFDEDIAVITQAKINAVDAIDKEFDNKSKEYAVSILQNFEKTFSGSKVGEELFGSLRNAMGADSQIQEIMNLGLTDKNGEPLFTEEELRLKIFESQLISFANNLKTVFGENGALPAALGTAAANMTSIFTNLKDTLDGAENPAETIGAIASAIAGSLQQLSSVYSAYMANNVKEIENLIEAEKARDGKSKESVQKLAQLEKKKEQLKRKEFETTKKLQLASAVASTAAGVAAALALGPLGIPLAAVVGAMGLAQIAIISKLKYGGGSQEVEKPSTNLTIGNRSNAVDVSQRATGGELNYLRGGRTSGTELGGAGGFLSGAAMGRKGYAMGGDGIVVGERGPEVITPSVPVDITPNFALGGGSSNVNFTINAVDAAGVEDVLMNQRGNIIRMIREAANENGEDFLTQVDPMAYGSKK